MKFFGKIGFIKTEEKSPDIFKEVVEERDYYGDVTRRTSRWQSTEYLNDDLNITNQFSILSDGYLLNNLGAMRYVVWHDTKWKIVSIEEQRPRIILTIGGVYNGDSS